MNRQRLSACALVTAALYGALLLSTEQLGAETLVTLDQLISDAAKDPTSFHRQEILIVLYLSQELSAKPPVDALLATAAALEQKKPGTNQQAGAVATASGTTTLTEKSGLADFLNLAIERGAITKTSSGTTYTLQTTPYLFYTKFGANDDVKAWEKSYLRRIGISATLDQNNGDSNQTGSDFESGEIKFKILGWRGTRDVLSQHPPDFSRMQNSLNQLTDALTKWMNNHPAFKGMNAEIQTYLQSGSVTEEGIRSQLAKSLKERMVKLTSDDLVSLKALVTTIESENEIRQADIREAVNVAQGILDQDHNKLSISGGYQRDATTSDYSTLKLLYDYTNTPTLSFNLNGELDINNKLETPEGVKLQRTRAYSVEGSLTAGKFANDSVDLTAALKWSRPMKDATAMTNPSSMFFVQTKLNLYLTRGVTIPVALTYSNRTEQSDHSSFRFNAGLAINADTFLGVARKGAS